MRPATCLVLFALGCHSAPEVVHAGALEIREAYAFETVLGDVASAYLSIRNAGALPDRLRATAAAEAGSVMIHQQVETDGRTAMRHLESVEIPAGATVVFAPGGVHLMLEQLAAPLAAGDTLDLVLHFDRAGDVRVRVPVRRYGDDE